MSADVAMVLFRALTMPCASTLRDTYLRPASHPGLRSMTLMQHRSFAERGLH
jgi:hypothetical protein